MTSEPSVDYVLMLEQLQAVLRQSEPYSTGLSYSTLAVFLFAALGILVLAVFAVLACSGVIKLKSMPPSKFHLKVNTVIVLASALVVGLVGWKLHFAAPDAQKVLNFTKVFSVYHGQPLADVKKALMIRSNSQLEKSVRNLDEKIQKRLCELILTQKASSYRQSAEFFELKQELEAKSKLVSPGHPQKESVALTMPGQ